MAKFIEINKPTVVPMAPGTKLILTVRMVNIALATNPLILSNDVAVNPGPFAPRNQVNNISVSSTEVNGSVRQSVSDNDPGDIVLQSFFNM